MVRPADYIHPEDEAARRNMEAIPGFAAAMKLFMRYYDEQIVHGMNMANKIRLSPTQLPEFIRNCLRFVKGSQFQNLSFISKWILIRMLMRWGIPGRW